MMKKKVQKKIDKKKSQNQPERIRIHKLLAEHGIGSRREIERFIKENRIKINGELAKLGDKASSQDKIQIDGKLVKLKPFAKLEPCRVIIYNKPEGEICTRKDPENRETVFHGLPKTNQRWILVGRLDLNSSGLLLFTNHGELAKRLMHPSSEIEREYAVRILGQVDEAQLKRLQKGVRLEDGMARFHEIKFAGGEGANRWYHVVIKEGRNREVRRLWQSQGISVSRLIRIRFGNVTLPRQLRRGKHSELSPIEIRKLSQLVDLKLS